MRAQKSCLNVDFTNKLMYTVDIGTYLGAVAVSSIVRGLRPAHAAIMRDEDLKNPNLPVME